MYIDPDYVEVDRGEIFRLVAAQPFATLVTDQPDLRVAHVPVEITRLPNGEDGVIAHVSALDPFAESVRARSEILVSVLGPTTYVSPQWYADRGLPTYNFVAIHLRGVAVPLDDPDRVRAHLMSLVKDHEHAAGSTWRVDGWARDRTTELLPELQAFTMSITSIAAKVKMGQNRTPADRVGVMNALEGKDSTDGRATAGMMRQRFDEKGERR